MATTAAKNAKGKIKIDRELCKGCKYCIAVCQSNLIASDGEINRSGYFPVHFTLADECTGCASCAQVCPEVAIEVWRT